MARKFGINVEEMSASNPILEEGFYAGIMTGATVVGKDNKQYIDVVEEQKWDKVKKEMVKTGNYVLQGMIMYGIVLISEKAKKKLLQDEPRLFGMINIRFDQTDGSVLLTSNPTLKQLIDVSGINFKELEAAVDPDIINSVQIPDELAHVPNIQTLMESTVYHRELFTLFCNTINGMPYKVQVCNRASRQDKSVQEHAIYQGTINQPFCGLAPYSEGSEFDLT
jgi:hypothetical protein